MSGEIIAFAMKEHAKGDIGHDAERRQASPVPVRSIFIAENEQIVPIGLRMTLCGSGEKKEGFPVQTEAIPVGAVL